MIVVVAATKTCESCPAQWEGRTLDDRMVYARYRWGRLTVHVSPSPTTDVLDAADAPPLLERRLGEDFDGSLSYEQLTAATRGEVSWP